MTAPRSTSVTVSSAASTVRSWFSIHSIALLRMSMGAVICGFGLLKLFPGMSPAQDLVVATTSILSFGLVAPGPAMLITAVLECIIGLSLLTGVWLRVTAFLIGAWLVGILSPTVLLFERLFGGPGHAPTLEGQYVLKDVVLVAATLVIMSGQHRNGGGSAQPPPVVIGSAGSAAHSSSDPSYTATSSTPSIVRAKASDDAATPPPQ